MNRPFDSIIAPPPAIVVEVEAPQQVIVPVQVEEKKEEVVENVVPKETPKEIPKKVIGVGMKLRISLILVMTIVIGIFVLTSYLFPTKWHPDVIKGSQFDPIPHKIYPNPNLNQKVNYQIDEILKRIPKNVVRDIPRDISNEIKRSVEWGKGLSLPRLLP